MPNLCLLQADARRIPMASGSVHCVVTSPPYWGLRDYGTAQWMGGDPDCDHKPPAWALDSGDASLRPETVLAANAAKWNQRNSGVCGKCGAERQDNQLGLESVPDCLGWATGAPCGSCYVCQMVQVFREVRRVLRTDGVCFLNLGDSYANDGKWGGMTGGKHVTALHGQPIGRAKRHTGLKPKDLVGIPWRVALALQADGWYLRSDIIWHKKAPMPESVTDRPTRSHEYIFLLTKSTRYFYDAEAVKEKSTGQIGLAANFKRESKDHIMPGQHAAQHRLDRMPTVDTGNRNSRSVWTLGPSPYPGAHFATFPPELPRRCIMAGTSEHGVCPACGAPWEREIEHLSGDTEAQSRPKKTAGMDSGTSTLSLSGNGSEEWAKRGSRQLTTGWRPTCACNAGDPVPATVLDPFAGSGTTLLAARALGRHGIGLDLSADYLVQARQRLDLDALDAWHNGKPVADTTMEFDALPLFG